LIAYFTGNISVKKYQNPFTCIRVIASQSFETRCSSSITLEVLAISTTTRSVQIKNQTFEVVRRAPAKDPHFTVWSNMQKDSLYWSGKCFWDFNESAVAFGFATICRPV